jgi:tripartite-type tricarboxylate transporter receptor subunit TctC
VVSATGPYKTLQDLIAAARAHPGRITYSSPNVGSAPHFGGAMLAHLTGTRMTAVHFKESGPMMTSVVNGDASFIVSVSGSSAPLVKAGKLRYLAAAAPTRLDIEAGVPSTPEAGGPAGFEVDTWAGIVAPRGTPMETVRRLNTEIGGILSEREVRERFRTLGFQSTPSTPAEMAALVRKDLRRYAELVKQIGITAE